MQRARYGLDLIRMDIKNAVARQKLRVKQQRTQSLEIDSELHIAKTALQVLRTTIGFIEKLEKRESEQRKILRNQGGRNSMVSTYGK